MDDLGARAERQQLERRTVLRLAVQRSGPKWQARSGGQVERMGWGDGWMAVENGLAGWIVGCRRARGGPPTSRTASIAALLSLVIRQLLSTALVCEYPRKQSGLKPAGLAEKRQEPHAWTTRTYTDELSHSVVSTAVFRP